MAGLTSPPSSFSLSSRYCLSRPSCQTESNVTITFTIRYSFSQPLSCQTESNVTVTFTIRYGFSQPLSCQTESNVTVTFTISCCLSRQSCQTESNVTITFTISCCLSRQSCQTESNVNRHLYYQVSVTTLAPVKQKAT